MSGIENTTFKHMEARHKASKGRVSAALSGKKNSDADRLVRWIFDTNMAPHDVFSDPAVAATFGTFEGVVSIIDRLQSGERVAFVRTTGAGPRIAFLNRKDKAFNRDFAVQVSAYGHGDDTVKAFYKPNGFLENVTEFIADAKQYADRRRTLADELSVFRG